MPSKHWGKPIITLRLPQWQITALKMIAHRNECTVSDLLHELIDAYLSQVEDIPRPTDAIPGQITANDLLE